MICSRCRCCTTRSPIWSRSAGCLAHSAVELRWRRMSVQTIVSPVSHYGKLFYGSAKKERIASVLGRVLCIVTVAFMLSMWMKVSCDRAALTTRRSPHTSTRTRHPSSKLTAHEPTHTEYNRTYTQLGHSISWLLEENSCGIAQHTTHNFSSDSQTRSNTTRIVSFENLYRIG